MSRSETNPSARNSTTMGTSIRMYGTGEEIAVVRARGGVGRVWCAEGSGLKDRGAAAGLARSVSVEPKMGEWDRAKRAARVGGRRGARGGGEASGPSSTCPTLSSRTCIAEAGRDASMDDLISATHEYLDGCFLEKT
eukprot:scaffold25484_cov112-Isochrysis_galbana.AAC.6